MTFLNPSLEKVFQVLVNNTETLNHLKKENLLITKSSLYENYTPEKVKEMELSIYVNNVNTLYEVAQVLLNYSEELKANQIWYLLSHKIAWKDLAFALGIQPEDLKAETYKQLVYTYKYCVVSSFFQNNRDKFIPETDLNEMEKNPAANAFYDAMMKEFDKLDVTINECLDFTDYDKIPYSKINYLTQLLGWEKKDMNADEDTEKQFRELAKNILDIYRIKGTNYSFELFFNFLGFNIEIKEYYFDRRMYYTNNSAGNQETESSNNSEYEYYLTINNPVDNKLENIGISEIVSPYDISEQYSLHEFNVLCKKYGPAAVLGYSPVYPVYNSNGDLVEYKEYTDKVYKYFKTNVIYYIVGLDNANPTEKQLTAITKYLEFLTPSYVMRSIKVDTFSESSEEPIGFNGDGSEDADSNGNYTSFQMLDDEDWSKDFENEFTTQQSSLLKKVKENNYKGKEETFENYVNSVGENKFRLPLGRKTLARSTSKFLTGGTGTNYPAARRLKFYILHTLNGEITNDWKNQNTIIAPYYTVPPFVGSDNYISMKKEWEKTTKQVNLTGGDGNGGEECVKTQIRDANLKTPIDYITNETIENFVANSEEFNELKISKTFARKLTKVRTIKYGSGKYANAYEAYLYELNQSKVHICNISCPNGAFESEIVWKDFEESNKTKFESEIYSEEKIKDFYKNEILPNLNFGDYILGYSGDLENGSLNLYRFAYTPIPIEQDEANYRNNYLNYLNSFDYLIVKDYNGSINRQGNVNLATNYISKATLYDVEEYVAELRNSMIEIAINEDISNWLPLDYITSKLFFITADGEYYRAVKTPAFSGISNNIFPSGKNHKFYSMTKAMEYFENYPEEKVNNAEFYVESGEEKGLYCFTYANRKNKLIYSTEDEKLYQTIGNSVQDVKELNNFYGELHLEYVGKVLEGYIDRYDYCWKGYDEEADEEDFIFYNSEHKINWENLNIKNKKISRPVKHETDLFFDKDSSKFLDSYDETKDINSFKMQSGIPTYYNTFGQRIIEEIASKTIDSFTDKEHIDWYIKDDSEHPNGLLSIIESNIKDLVGDIQSNDFRYYSKVSDFIQDYYRIIVLGNYSENSIPKEIFDALVGNKKNPKITATLQTKIFNAYNKAVKEMAEVIDSISKDRIYYSFVDNWKKITEGSIYEWEVVPRDDEGKINAEFVYSNPLDNSYGPRENKKIGNQYYFDEKTGFIGKIIATINDLKNKYGDNIRFNIDNSLFGKDPYSLIFNGTERFGDYNKFGDYEYNYKVYKGEKTLNFGNTHFYLSYDSLYNFYLPYSLNYGLKNYSKDFYNEHRDIYSEFTELFDLLNSFADENSDENKEAINDFLKNFYYKKLVELYREAPIEDNYPINISNASKKPMKAYPKLYEKLDGKGGTFSSPTTLLSTINLDGKKANSTKLGFSKVEIKTSSDYKTTTFNFYIKRQDFINCFGYDYSRYYKNLDLSKFTNQTVIKQLSETIEKGYKEQFACLRPHFFAKHNIYNENKISNWQAVRKNFEVDFRDATAVVVDNEYKKIVDSDGNVINKDGLRVGNTIDVKKRLQEAENIIITIVDNKITPLLNLNANKEFFVDMNEDEQGNINGYLTVKKLTQTFKDNYVSKPYNLDWVEKDVEGEPTEYTSFGDDRFLNISVKNSAINMDTYNKYYNAAITETKHEEEVMQFDIYGHVLTDSGYVSYDKTKTIEDQGLKPIYKTVEEKPVIENADGDSKKHVSFVDEQGNEMKINYNDFEFFFDSETNEPVLSISPEVLKIGNITKVKILYNLLYVNVKKIYSLITSYIKKPVVSQGVNPKTKIKGISNVKKVIGHEMVYQANKKLLSKGLIRLIEFIASVFINKKNINSKAQINFKFYDNINLPKKVISSLGKLKKKITANVFLKPIVEYFSKIDFTKIRNGFNVKFLNLSYLIPAIRTLRTGALLKDQDAITYIISVFKEFGIGALFKDFQINWGVEVMSSDSFKVLLLIFMKNIEPKTDIEFLNYGWLVEEDILGNKNYQLGFTKDLAISANFKKEEVLDTILVNTFAVSQEYTYKLYNGKVYYYYFNVEDDIYDFGNLPSDEILQDKILVAEDYFDPNWAILQTATLIEEKRKKISYKMSRVLSNVLEIVKKRTINSTAKIKKGIAKISDQIISGVNSIGNIESLAITSDKINKINLVEKTKTTNFIMNSLPANSNMVVNNKFFNEVYARYFRNTSSNINVNQTINFDNFLVEDFVNGE